MSPPVAVSGNRRRIAFGIAAALAVQGLATVAYVLVERGREARKNHDFGYESVHGIRVLPAIALERADGKRVQTSELRGRPVLLHFWATWCPPCRVELAGLLRLGHEEPAIQVVALTLDDDWARVREFFGGDVPPEVVRDPSGSVVKTYEVGTLPDTYLIDRNGAATLRFGGARDWTDRRVRELFAQH